MKTIILTFTIALMLFTSKTSYAQLDSFFVNNVSKYDSSGLFYFYPNKLTPGELFSHYHYYFFGDTLNTMDSLRFSTDSFIHYNHYKYQQKYMGVKVEGAEFIEHSYMGYLVYAYGKIADLNDEIIQPDSLSDSMAFDSLSKNLNYFVNHLPAWNDSDWQQDYRINIGDSAARYYPKGELLWALDNFRSLGFMIPRSRYRLAWRYEILYVGDSSLNKIYYVDAYTGEVFRVADLMKADGIATTSYNGVRSIDTETKTFPVLYGILRTDNNNRHVQTKYSSSKAWWKTPNVKKYITQPYGEQWGTIEWKATDVHWAGTRAWDFFQSQFKRNGMDNNGSEVRIHANLFDPNAYFDKNNGANNLSFGNAVGKYLGSVDIVGHEWMHGITSYSSQLNGYDEQGALDESFSDIMGIMLKRNVTGQDNWLMGDDLGTAVDIDPYFLRRSFQTPKLFGKHYTTGTPYAGQPTTYFGQYWCSDPSIDNGGIHVNNSVQNYWFYLLAKGGAGTNDNGDAYIVNGIGADKAALIAYFTNVNHLTSSSNYHDAQSNSIAVATALYGPCSNEEIQTQNAWAAVGIGYRSICSKADIRPINELAANSPSLFPNPSHNSFNILFNDENNYSVSIFAADGKLVKIYKNINNSTNTISTEDLPSGFYNISISSDNGNVCLKLIKQ